MDIIVDNLKETMKLGEKIGSLVNSGDILCLTGDLGTGKTHFVKGLALGLKISEPITSPTFTLVNEYEGRLKLNHFDVYRIEEPDEINTIGFDEYIFSSAVSIIEWSDLIQEFIPEENLHIHIEKLPEKGVDFRKIKISYTGERYSYIKELNL